MTATSQYFPNRMSPLKINILQLELLLLLLGVNPTGVIRHMQFKLMIQNKNKMIKILNSLWYTDTLLIGGNG